MTQTSTDALTRQEIVELTRETTLYEWAVQSAMKPW